MTIQLSSVFLRPGGLLAEGAPVGLHASPRRAGAGCTNGGATDAQRLSFVPSGTGATSIVTASQSELPEVVAALRARFSLVLVYAGSATGPHVISLGRRADAAYLEVRLGHTSRQAAADATLRLRQAGVPLRGCILTGA